MLEVIKRFTFEAAHRLNDYDGPCAHVHGHSYKLDIGVAQEGPARDMIIDFKHLKELVEENIISRWDHSYLNVLDEFNVEGRGLTPTAENMVMHALHVLQPIFLRIHLTLTLIDLWETGDSHARWTCE